MFLLARRIPTPYRLGSANAALSDESGLSPLSGLKIAKPDSSSVGFLRFSKKFFGAQRYELLAPRAGVCILARIPEANNIKRITIILYFIFLVSIYMYLVLPN